MTNTMDNVMKIAGESYSRMLSRYETDKRRLGEVVAEEIKANGYSLSREDNPELFDLIDLYQLDDAYILNAMNYEAHLYGHKVRTGTKYRQSSYEIKLG